MMSSFALSLVVGLVVGFLIGVDFGWYSHKRMLKEQGRLE